MNQSTDDKSAQPTFETALAELESIVHDLEGGQEGLAESLARYERGVSLLKQCYSMLERAERRIELLSGVDADGNPIAEPFAEASDSSLEAKSRRRGQRRTAPRRSDRREAEDAGSPPDDIDEPQGLF